MSTKLMLVYQSLQRRPALEAAVAENGYVAAAWVESGADLQQALVQSGAEVLVLDIERPDERLLRRLHDLSQHRPLPMVIFAQAGDRAVITAAVNAGVAAYVVNGLSPQRLGPILDAAVARFHAFQSLRNDLRETREKLEERKQIDRAKGILMRHKQVSEDQAYHALRKLAMDRNIRIGEAACNVIAMEELLA